MPSIEQLIDAEIQQLNELKKMSKNPRMVELMRQLVSTNGSAAPAPVPTPATPKVVAPSQTKGSAKSDRKTAPNGLMAAVLQAVAVLKTRFSIPDIAAHLTKEGFEFVSKNPRIAVSAPIERLVEKGIVKLARRGVGNQPSLYDYVGEKQE